MKHIPSLGPYSREALMSLLAVKDSDLRIDVVHQGDSAVDRGAHIGGSFSELIPLITMVYGGFISIDPIQPDCAENDVFILSKGHGIAGMVSVYSDIGFLDRKIFDNCRCYTSILNGHPGPALRGVDIATGALGQGVAVAVGMAMAQKIAESGKTFCLLGDGEMQEGMPWETFMYAGAQKLGNLCVVIDRNNGQNDSCEHIMLSLGDLKAKLEAFGFRVFDVDGSRYGTIYSAFETAYYDVNDRPVAIISNCIKGEGGFCSFTQQHKPTVSEVDAINEISQQEQRRALRVANFCKNISAAEQLEPDGAAIVFRRAAEMNYDVERYCGHLTGLSKRIPKVYCGKLPIREKALQYDVSALPSPKVGENIRCSDIVSGVIAAMGVDKKLVTIDADMGLISGLQPGMNRICRQRALNAGIAESNIMGMAEAFAARGYNAWCATFGMFFDWRVLRRISVTQQERLESIASDEGWLSDGHALDITFLVPAANLDTQVNGATHMSIDDANALMQVPHLKIIDVACPRMMLAAMRWIGEGGRGLILLRMTRAASRVIYGDSLKFEYGKGYVHGDADSADIIIVTSGRGIYEALEAASLISKRGTHCAVVDMPSFDGELLEKFNRSGKRLIFAEQNNGFLFDKYLSYCVSCGATIDLSKTVSLSTLTHNRESRHLPSGTYKELLSACGLTPAHIADAAAKLK